MTVESTHLRLEHSDIVFMREIIIWSVSPACQNLQHSRQNYTSRNKTVTAVSLFPVTRVHLSHQLITHWRLCSLLKEGSIFCSTLAICSSTFHPVYLKQTVWRVLQHPAEIVNDIHYGGTLLVSDRSGCPTWLDKRGKYWCSNKYRCKLVLFGGLFLPETFSFLALRGSSFSSSTWRQGLAQERAAFICDLLSSEDTVKMINMS